MMLCGINPSSLTWLIYQSINQCYTRAVHQRHKHITRARARAIVGETSPNLQAPHIVHTIVLYPGAKKKTHWGKTTGLCLRLAGGRNNTSSHKCRCPLQGCLIDAHAQGEMPEEQMQACKQGRMMYARTHPKLSSKDKQLLCSNMKLHANMLINISPHEECTDLNLMSAQHAPAGILFSSWFCVVHPKTMALNPKRMALVVSCRCWQQVLSVLVLVYGLS